MFPPWARRLLFVGGALLLFGLAGPARADSTKSDTDRKSTVPVTGTSSAKYARFDELMTATLDRYKLPGGVLAVARDGKLVYARGFGYSDLDKKAVMKPDALFRISSMSKPFTAVAVMKLVEEDKLKLDDKVMDVLALKPTTRKFDERWRKVTIRHLLEHRGGWDKNRSFDPMFYSPLIVKTLGGRHPATPEQTVRFMLRRPLDFEPGEKYVYSNFGYCLLGRVIEKVSKQKYEAFVKAKVLEPLGLERMRQGRTLLALRAPGEVRYYSTARGQAVLGPQFARQVPFAYGGFCLEQMDSESGWLGSASDLVHFACAFVDPKKCKVLKPATVESLFERPEGEKGKPTYYGKGWFVQPWEKGTRSFWHDGALAGVSGLVVHRADGITFAVLFNTDRAGDHDPAAIMEQALREPLKQVFGAK